MNVISRVALGTTLAEAIAVVPLHYGITLAVVPAQLGGGTTLAVVPRCRHNVRSCAGRAAL